MSREILELKHLIRWQATHETWNTTQLQETLSKSTGNNNNNNNQQTSPTVHNPPGEVVSIDGDYLPQSRPRCMFVTNNGSLSTTPDIPSPSVAWNRARAGPADGRDRWPEMHSPTGKDCGLTEKDRPSDSEAPSYTSQYVPGFLWLLTRFISLLILMIWMILIECQVNPLAIF